MNELQTPCTVCTETFEAAKTLVALRQTCPMCKRSGVYKDHAEHGHPKCSSCESIVCGKCMYGCRYMCPIIKDWLAQPAKVKKTSK